MTGTVLGRLIGTEIDLHLHLSVAPSQDDHRSVEARWDEE